MFSDLKTVEYIQCLNYLVGLSEQMIQPKVRNSIATEQLISVNRHMWVAAY